MCVCMSNYFHAQQQSFKKIKQIPVAHHQKVNLQTQYSLHRDEESRNVEGFKEDLSCLLTISAWVERSFCQEHWMLRKQSKMVCYYHTTALWYTWHTSKLFSLTTIFSIWWLPEISKLPLVSIECEGCLEASIYHCQYKTMGGGEKYFSLKKIFFIDYSSETIVLLSFYRKTCWLLVLLKIADQGNFCTWNRGHEQADRLANITDITTGLQVGKAEVLKGLRDFLNMDRSDHLSNDHLKERGVSTLQGWNNRWSTTPTLVPFWRQLWGDCSATLGRLLKEGQGAYGLVRALW